MILLQLFHGVTEGLIHLQLLLLKLYTVSKVGRVIRFLTYVQKTLIVRVRTYLLDAKRTIYDIPCILLAAKK